MKTSHCHLQGEQLQGEHFNHGEKGNPVSGSLSSERREPLKEPQVLAGPCLGAGSCAKASRDTQGVAPGGTTRP